MNQETALTPVRVRTPGAEKSKYGHRHKIPCPKLIHKVLQET